MDDIMVDHIRLAVSVLIVLLFLTSLIGCASKRGRSHKLPSPPKKPTHLEMPKVKPPLGLMPRYIWNQQRVLMIDAAMDRYKADGREIPSEWLEELDSLQAREKVIKEQSSVIRFYEDCMCVRRSSSPIFTTSEVYRVYEEWCANNNKGRAVSFKHFRDGLASYLNTTFTEMRVRHRTGSVYKDFTLKQGCEPKNL